MKRRYFSVFILVTLIGTICNFAAPVSAGPLSPPKPAKEGLGIIRYPTTISQGIGQINRWQRELNRRIAVLAKDIEDGSSPQTFLTLLVLSFLYGAVHALGPGHGKTLVFSYFLSRGTRRWQKGLILGNLIAFLHASSATIIVLFIYFFIRTSLMNHFDTVNLFIKGISSVMISGVGLFLLYQQIKRIVTPQMPEVSATEDLFPDRSLFSTALAVGIVPCPGAVIVLLFSISLGLLAIGLIMVFCMALGMAVTISLMGVLSITAGQGIRRAIPHGMRLWERITGVAGAVLIVLAGLLFWIMGI
jgi:nickel/cobalt exporter